MHDKQKKDANYIKTILIDYLLQNENYDLIVNEAPFLQGGRWADLIAIKDNFLIGFEIKSELDSLKTLLKQIDDYNKVFNKVFLVIADKFINSEEIKKIPKNVGVLILTNNSLQQKKRAILVKKTNKEALAMLLWRKELEDLMSIKNMDIHELRDSVVSKKSLTSIHSAVLNALKKRYKQSYSLFLRDRGDYTTLEDLRTITRINKGHRFL